MTLLFCDGFDHYTSAALKYNYQAQNTIGAGSARPGGVQGVVTGGGAGAGGYLDRVIPNTQILVAGVAWKQTQPNQTEYIFAFMDSQSYLQVEVRMGGTARTLKATRNNNLLGESSKTFLYNNWYYVEMKAKIAASPDGYVIVHVNGEEWINVSGVNTRTSANSYANIFRLWGPAYAAQYFDDVYVCDASTAPNSDFLGDIKVKAFFPSAAGSYTQWTPNSAVANYTTVDEYPPNDDTDYNYATTAGYKDSYNYQDMPANAVSILAVVPYLYARKDDAGSRHVQLVTRVASTDYLGNDCTLLNNYALYSQIYETNPNTAIVWTLSDFNGAEFGINLIS